MTQTSQLAILGGGSWGTALALTFAPNFARTMLWVHNASRAEALSATRLNDRYLPGFPLPCSIHVTSDLAVALEQSATVLIAVPSAHLRAIVTAAAPYFRIRARLITAAKGLEACSTFRMSQVIEDAVGPGCYPVLALSGPSFASEVAAGKPTAVVIAGPPGDAQAIQCAFARPAFRTYTSADLIGVEMGGALKNIVAIGAGIATGLGLGHNAVSALITRGLSEISRVALRLGAEPRTLSGLSGLGDLVLTCTGDLSRNRKVGIELSQGRTVTNVLESMYMVAEGTNTASVALELGTRLGIELPLCEQMNAVLERTRSPSEAIHILMNRALREE